MTEPATTGRSSADRALMHTQHDAFRRDLDGLRATSAGRCAVRIDSLLAAIDDALAMNSDEQRVFGGMVLPTQSNSCARTSPNATRT